MNEVSKQNSKECDWAAVGRDWGVHLKRNIQYRKAGQYFKRSLETNPQQFRTLLESSKCKLKQNGATAALNDVNICLKLEPNNVKAKHQHAKCLAHLNRIESAFSAAHAITVDHPTKKCVHRTKNSLEMSLSKSFGPSAVPILRKYKLYLKRNQEETNAEPSDSPIREHRQKAIEVMRHKLYFDATFAEQVEFWSQLQKDETLDESLHQIIDRIIENLNSHENMLYVREPFHAKRDHFDMGSLVKASRRRFYFAQEETRREAMWQLRNIKALAVTSFTAALMLTERVLSEFYAVKRRIVFPAKFEFLCAICHFIGTEYLKIYRRIPPKLMSLNVKDRLTALFNVRERMRQGDEICDKKVKYFINRLKHTEYDIEKAYICHQLSETCIRYRRPEESQRFARDAVSHASKCKSNVWLFLGYFNIIRVDAIKHNYHPMKDDLNELQRITANLDALCQVVVSTAIRSFEDIKSTTN